MTKKRTDYTLTYKGLSEGNHPFDFEIGDPFFRSFPESEIKKGRCTAHIDLQRENNLLTLDVHIKGNVRVECDYCLEEYDQPVDFCGTLIVKFSGSITGPQLDTDNKSNTEILWINPADDRIDLTQYLYDSIHLSLPMQRVHPLDEQGKSQCNELMLSMFKTLEDDFTEIEEVEEAEAAEDDDLL